MHIFIDESGVHKQLGNSTVALVYVAVENIDNLNNAITQIEKNLHIEPFHWNKQIWPIRFAFLKALSKENFTVKAAIIENPFTEEDFELALQNLLTDKLVRNIIIDGRKPSKYVLRLKNVLRHRGVSVKKIRMGNDLAFPVLRLADLFAGLIRAYFEEPDKKPAKELYYLAENKITTQTYLGGQVFR